MSLSNSSPSVDTEEDRKTGRVRSIKREPGYGFVRSDGKDYFFHMSSFVNEEDFFDIEPGAKITFVLFDAMKGIQAGKIKVIDFKRTK